MEVFAVNATMGPEGRRPMLIMFGDVPRAARSSTTEVERQKAIEEAKKEVEKEQSRRRTKFSLKHTARPKMKRRFNGFAGPPLQYTSTCLLNEDKGRGRSI